MKNYLLLIFSFTLLLSCQKEEPKPTPVSIGDFRFSSEYIHHNEPFTITYTGESELGVNFYHQLVHDKVYPTDIIFENNEANISIADSVSAVAFYFSIDNELDNNGGDGYVFYAKNKDNTKPVEAEAALQTYLMFEGAYNNLNGADAEKAIAAIEQTLEKSPELSEKWFESHIRITQKLDNNKSEILAKDYVSQIDTNENASLKEYEKMQKIYSAAWDKEALDSIHLLIINKFPKSEIAENAIVNDYFDLKTFEEKLDFFETNNMQNFKTSDINFVYVDLANNYFKKDDIKNFEENLNKITQSQNKSSMLNNFAWGLAEKDIDLDYASKLSKQSLDIVQKEKIELKDQPDYYSTNQYKTSLGYEYRMYADTYAYVNYKQGNLKEAISYQKEAVENGNNPVYNERYIQFLAEDEQFEKVIEKSENYITEGYSTEKIKTYFEEAFLKLYPDKDVTSMITQFEIEAKLKQTEKLKKKIINQDAPAFAVKNLDGELISLASYKGKTVILDLWATWCGPCIDSFPGMQKAVDKYKDNEEVVFLFIDTFENGSNREETVSEFIEKNNYDFHVLIDPFDAGKSSYEIASNYNVSGIPTKFIIDKEGKIRFKDFGFDGSTDKLVTKIDIMIELVQ